MREEFRRLSSSSPIASGSQLDYRSRDVLGRPAWHEAPLPQPNLCDRIALYTLSAVVALAPLPFGSVDDITVSFWCFVLGSALVVAVNGTVDYARTPMLMALGTVAALLAGVVGLQIMGPAWLVGQDPIWTKAEEALGPLMASPTISRGQPFFALGNLLACMAAMAVGLMLGADRRSARRVLSVFAASGLGYAVYAIAAAKFTPAMVLWLARPTYYGDAIGPFLYRNTAASYFGCCSCLWLAYTCRHVRKLGAEDILDALSGRGGASLWRLRPLILLIAGTLTCTTALFLTASRAGTILSLSAMGVLATHSLWDSGWRPRSARQYWAGAAIVTCLLFVMGGSVSQRFGTAGFSDENRLDVYRSTLHVIADHPWLGTGLGTFPMAFPTYRSIPPNIWGRWMMAHSTPLETAAELGIPMTAALTLGLLAALVQLLRGVRATRGRDIGPLVAAAALSIAMVHSCIDFPLQIPGFAIVLLSLVGVGLSRSSVALARRRVERAAFRANGEDGRDGDALTRQLQTSLHCIAHAVVTKVPPHRGGAWEPLSRQSDRSEEKMPTGPDRTEAMRELLARVTIIPTVEREQDVIHDLLSGERTQVVSFLNQHAFNLACESVEFHDSLSNADILLRDGVGIEVAFKLIGWPAGLNANGTDLIPRLLTSAVGRTVAVFGTQQPWLGTSVARMQAAGVRVVASLDGFRRRQDYMDAVRAADPDIVVLAMGMPRQEIVADALRVDSNRPRLIVNGGAILDFYAQRFRRAPPILQKFRLEWLFRLAQEPRRLVRRYVVGGVRFAWWVAKIAVRERVTGILRMRRPISDGR